MNMYYLFEYLFLIILGIYLELLVQVKFFNSLKISELFSTGS